MSFAKECNSKRIDNVTLFKPKFTPNQGSNSNNGNKRRRRQIKLFHLIFMIIYLYMGYWCFQTCGGEFFVLFCFVLFCFVLFCFVFSIM